MNKIIAIGLIVIALGVGYIGANKLAASNESINFLGLKISATDESAKTEGFVYLGLAIVLFAGGIFTLRKSK